MAVPMETSHILGRGDGQFHALWRPTAALTSGPHVDPGGLVIALLSFNFVL